MFEHRLGALLGLSLDSVLNLPQRELSRWRKYWNEEPWGPHRDNMHAAIIIQNLYRAMTGADVPMQSFIFENTDDVRERERIATALKLEALANAGVRK